MSPSWLDRYVAVLTPERAAIVRRRRGWGDNFDLKADAPCADPSPQAAAEALGQLLARPEIGRGNLTLLLSNHFVRYLLVPWSDGAGDPTEFAAYARICCDQVFGTDALGNGGRILRISREKAGRPRLAAVVEAAFLNALEDVVADTRLHLASIQPYLAAAYNRLGKACGQEFIFVLAEPERSCLLAATGGGWSSVRTNGVEDRPDALAHLIDREAQLLGIEADNMPPVFIHAPRQARLDVPACNGVKPRTLSLPIPASLASAADSLLTMAMVVA